MNKNDLTKKMKALAGIEEGDKKFLTNEIFLENYELSKNDSNIENWKGMDSMPMGKNDIPGAIPYPDGWKEIDGVFMGPNGITQNKLDHITELTKIEEDSDFSIIEIDQIDVAPGEEDDKLYNIG